MRQSLLELRGRPLPVPRPPRARRGDPGRRRRAVAAAGLLDDPAELREAHAIALARQRRAVRARRVLGCVSRSAPATALGRAVAPRGVAADAPRSARQRDAPTTTGRRAARRSHRRSPAPAPAARAAAKKAREARRRPKSDPLVSNGLGSPLCKGALGQANCPAAGRRNCETSGFVAAAAPTGQLRARRAHRHGRARAQPRRAAERRAGPARHAPVDGAGVGRARARRDARVVLHDRPARQPAASGVGRGLRQMQASAHRTVAADRARRRRRCSLLYDGLVRRRVAETLGEALLMGAMMVGGLWVIADPTGTVGALGAWANEASLGTLAVAARGTPARPGRALGQSMGTSSRRRSKCRGATWSSGTSAGAANPPRLEPRLRAAGAEDRRGGAGRGGCRPSSGRSTPCAAAGGAQARALAHSAQLLREARSNGAIFLALPANGPGAQLDQRTGLAAADDLPEQRRDRTAADPTAAQAEFRTTAGPGRGWAGCC